MALPQLPFSSYAPHPSIPGAYNFTPVGGGNPMMFTGDTTAMRQAIDASAPPMLANNASNQMPTGDISGAIQGFNQQDSTPKSAPMAHDATAAPANPLNINNPMSALTPAQQPTPPTPQPGAETANMEAGGNAAPAPVPVRDYGGGAQQPVQQQGGGQAPDLSNLDKMYTTTTTKAGFRPTTKSLETTGGMDPAIANKAMEAYAAQAQADATGAELQKLTAQHAIQQNTIEAADAASKLEAIQQKQLARQAAIQQGADEFNSIMAQKQDELANASKREVDQYRLYRSNAGAAIGAALGAALGAFGSAIAHTPNFALDFINRSIDRDVEAQRDEINRGVASKQNDIARIRDKYNVDTSTAEKLLQISLTEQAQQMARKQAAMANNQAAMEKLAGIDKQLADANVARWKAIQDNVMGKAVAKAEEKYTPGGTSVQLTPQVQGRTKAAEAYGKTGEALGKGASGEFQAAHEGRTATQADKTAAVNAGDITPQLSRPFVAAQTALEGLDRLEGAIKKGMANRVGQKLERLGADTDIAAEADHTSQSVGFGEANGNVPNDKRVESLKHNFESMNPEQALAHIHALRETFLEKQRSIVNTSKRTARVGHTAPVESSE